MRLGRFAPAALTLFSAAAAPRPATLEYRTEAQDSRFARAFETVGQYTHLASRSGR